ncbi:uncharacterized protein MELLADRAFT_113622 [Melampsora larici-populina 98AG31]|uniref:Uncharacterized protein n=1 Tax=Melampsora larici-populina (strain 98AG31 / pathotype 3-4-7) TaxID=747676 RepID=F4SAI2_MELLP|nr:uncharacterized protein MELLADRAFT_113622 [Melampsora larici-populina 98AG31]EGF98353.1 hypothetical protein MELLADRAFT_113622 [Melampsora larici-populina 98AG31]
MIPNQSLKSYRRPSNRISKIVHHQREKIKEYLGRKIYQDSNFRLTGRILLDIRDFPAVIEKTGNRGTRAEVNGREFKFRGHLCGWRRKKRPNRKSTDSIKSDLEAAALPTPLISRPLRLLPVGQSFTIVKSPLSSNPQLKTPPRLRSASAPMSANHAVPRKRTIVWFDEMESRITFTHSGSTSGAQHSDPSSESRPSDSSSDSISLRSGRSHSLSILPESNHELRRESSLETKLPGSSKAQSSEVAHLDPIRTMQCRARTCPATLEEIDTATCQNYSHMPLLATLTPAQNIQPHASNVDCQPTKVEIKAQIEISQIITIKRITLRIIRHLHQRGNKYQNWWM